jgi:hypothetical protein
MASANKARVLKKRAKRQEAYLKANTVAAACDRFLKSRGIAPQRENFNRSFTTEEPKPDGLQIP